MTPEQLETFNEVNETSSYNAVCCDDWAFQICHNRINSEPKFKTFHACAWSETWEFIPISTKTCRCGETMSKNTECVLNLMRLEI